MKEAQFPPPGLVGQVTRSELFTENGEGGSKEDRQVFAEFLDIADLVVITTLSPAGWPVTHCMHFGTVFTPDRSPILYLFSKPNTRKLENIANEPRVSGMIFSPQAAPDPRKVPSARLWGVCTLVTDPDEHRFAMECQFGKLGYGFSRLLGLHKQPALRIDVVSALWKHDGDSTDRPVGINYLVPVVAGANSEVGTQA